MQLFSIAGTGRLGDGLEMWLWCWGMEFCSLGKGRNPKFPPAKSKKEPSINPQSGRNELPLMVLIQAA